MSATVGRWTDIIGAALILGLLLRYGNSAALLITRSSHAFVDIFGVVSLQSSATQPRTSVGQAEVTAKE